MYTGTNVQKSVSAWTLCLIFREHNFSSCIWLHMEKGRMLILSQQASFSIFFNTFAQNDKSGIRSLWFMLWSLLLTSTMSLMFDCFWRCVVTHSCHRQNTGTGEAGWVQTGVLLLFLNSAGVVEWCRVIMTGFLGRGLHWCTKEMSCCQPGVGAQAVSGE